MSVTDTTFPDTSNLPAAMPIVVVLFKLSDDSKTVGLFSVSYYKTTSQYKRGLQCSF